jgi:hypothetical protein
MKRQLMDHVCWDNIQNKPSSLQGIHTDIEVTKIEFPLSDVTVSIQFETYMGREWFRAYRHTPITANDPEPLGCYDNLQEAVTDCTAIKLYREQHGYFSCTECKAYKETYFLSRLSDTQKICESCAIDMDEIENEELKEEEHYFEIMTGV